MKKILTTIWIMIALLSVPTASNAQSAAVKKATDTVFTLTTYKANGSILATAYGVFIGNDGTSVSPWKPFNGADHAVVIDAKGGKHDVEVMLGGNEIYNLAKFRIKGNVPATIQLNTQHPVTNSQTWIVSNKKSNIPQSAVIKDVETFMEKYQYTILTTDATDMYAGCPVVDNNGKLIGLFEISSTTKSATDVHFIQDFKLTGLSLNDPTLRQTNIRIGLPTEKEQAQLALMFATETNNSKYQATIADFIHQFPTLNDGYYAAAMQAVNQNDYSKADYMMTTAISKVVDKAEAHFNYAHIIYQANSFKQQNTTLPLSWTLDKAQNETKEAYKVSPLPHYQQLEAQILFAKEEYQQAYDLFMELTKSPISNSELYYQAMLTRQQMGAEDQDLLLLLDKAIEACDTPYTVVAAPYFLARAIQYDKMQNYRSAMIDFYQYEALSYNSLGADFYFMRGQSEMRGKQYQPAINDIAHAVALEPGNALYWAELASANLRVGLRKETIIAAEQCIKLAPEAGEAYLMLGIAQVESSQKAEGLENIRKAKLLGNEQADLFLKKYE